MAVELVEDPTRDCYWGSGSPSGEQYPIRDAVVNCRFRKRVVGGLLVINYMCCHPDQRTSEGACPPWDESGIKKSG